MKTEQLIKNLCVPEGVVDAILDTDTYNEIDDQFALAYFLRSSERINPVAVYAAPFLNFRSESPADGMKKSYDEIFKVLDLAECENMKSKVYKGSESFLADEKTPVISDAANDLVSRAMNYSPEKPLYVVAIGAITNIASALLINPEIKDNIVVIWLGGHATHWVHTHEFNMFQDIAAARVVFGSGVPLVQLPCTGVVDGFTFSKCDLDYWLVGKNKLADYLASNTIEYENKLAGEGRPWSKVIWDVTAVAWLLNDNSRFMLSRIEHTPIPEYDSHYSFDSRRQFYNYVYYIKKVELFEDLCKKILK